MNIDSIKIYPASLAKAKHQEQDRNVPEYDWKRENSSADKYKQLNRGYQSDSLMSVKNNEAVTFGSKAAIAKAAKNAVVAVNSPVGKDNLFDKILKLCDNHTVIAQNLVALFLAVGPRPLAIMFMPGVKDKEDRIYASSHAIASGIIGFGFSSLVMYPLGQGVKKAKAILKSAKINDTKALSDKTIKFLKDTFKVENLKELEHSKAFKNVTKIMDMAPDVFIFGVLKAILTIKLIKPILKYGFGLEKKSKDNKETPQQNNETLAKKSMLSRPSINKFAGGLK